MEDFFSGTLVVGPVMDMDTAITMDEDLAGLMIKPGSVEVEKGRHILA